MAKVDAEAVENGRLAKYKVCEKCNASFDRLYIGGDGDWRQTIMCEQCYYVRKAIPLEIIWELIAQQYPEIGTAEKAKKADEESQRSYQATLNKYAVDPTAKMAGTDG